MNVRNRNVYVKKETDYNHVFWHKHCIWAFDFYITKKWNYHEYLNLTNLNLNIPKSHLCYICERELRYDIFYLTDYLKVVSIGKCCIKRYKKSYDTQYNTSYNTYNTIKKRFKIKEE